MSDTLKTLGLMVILSAGVYALLGITDTRPKANGNQPILIHDATKIAPGMSLHTVRRTSRAWLVDNEGVVQHEWNIKKYIPTESKYTLSNSPLQHVEPSPDGSLLAVIKDSAIARFDSQSNLLSFTEGHFHHDVDRLDDGTLVTLERQPLSVAFQDLNGVLLNDHIVVINPDGTRRAEYPLFQMVADRVSRESVERAFAFSAAARHKEIKNDTPADILHTNSLEILRKDIPGVAPAGSALVSFRELSLIAIVDFKAQKALWEYGQDGQLSGQHAPTVLANGNILLFDNGKREKSSRVIELDPRTNKIVWQFDASHYDEAEFYSPSRGSAERLDNGNTLISIADVGTVIEVTQKKEIVWKYIPRVTLKRKNGEKVTRGLTLYRVFKVQDSNLLGKLTGSGIDNGNLS